LQALGHASDASALPQPDSREVYNREEIRAVGVLHRRLGCDLANGGNMKAFKRCEDLLEAWKSWGESKKLEEVRSGYPAAHHAIENWIRLRAFRALDEDLVRQVDDAEDRLPEWAQVGPKWLRGAGVAEEKGLSEDPAITATAPVKPGVKINIRPSADDIRAAHNARYERIRNGPGGEEASCRFMVAWIAEAECRGHPVDSALKRGAEISLKRFAGRPADPDASSALGAFKESLRIRDLELAAHERRQEAQAGERKRVGLVELEAEQERVADEIGDLICEFLSSELRSPHALAAAIIIKIDDTDDETADILRASVGTIRPQLIGAIAEDADRVLANAEGARAVVEAL